MWPFFVGAAGWAENWYSDLGLVNIIISAINDVVSFFTSLFGLLSSGHVKYKLYSVGNVELSRANNPPNDPRYIPGLWAQKGQRIYQTGPDTWELVLPGEMPTTQSFFVPGNTQWGYPSHNTYVQIGNIASNQVVDQNGNITKTVDPKQLMGTHEPVPVTSPVEWPHLYGQPTQYVLVNGVKVGGGPQGGGGGGGNPNPNFDIPLSEVKANLDNVLNNLISAVAGEPSKLVDLLKPIVDTIANSLILELDKLITALPSLKPGAPPPEIDYSALLGSIRDQLITLAGSDAGNLIDHLQSLFACVCPSLDNLVTAIGKLQTQEWESAGFFTQLVGLGFFAPEVAKVTPQSGPLDHTHAAHFDDKAHARRNSKKYIDIYNPATALVGAPAPPLSEAFHEAATDVTAATLRYIIGMLVGSLEGEASKLTTKYGPLVASIWASVKPYLTTVLTDTSGILEEIPKLILDTIATIAAPSGIITPDNAEDVAFKTLGWAFLVGQGIHLVADLAGYLGWPMSSLWGHNATIAVDLLAYDEIRSNLHKAYFPNLFGEKIRQHYAAHFAPMVGTRGDAALGFARRKIDQPTRDKLFSYSGLDPTYYDLVSKLGYRPLSPFILERMFVNREYPTEQMKAAFEDMAVRPEDVDMINEGMAAMSTQQLENQYATQLEQAYAKGAVADSDVTNALNDMGWSKKAQDLTLKRMAVVRTVDLITDVVKEYTPEVVAGMASGDQMKSAMIAAGAQEWFADWKVSIAVSKAALASFKREETDAIRKAREALNLETRAAIELYIKGQIDLTTLTTALAAAETNYLANLASAGLTPTDMTAEIQLGAVRVAAEVTSAQAKLVLHQRLIFGMQLPADQAEILHSQVAALLQQYKYSLIDAGQLTAALQGYKIPDAEVTAIVAKATAKADAAALAASPPPPHPQ